MVTHINVGSAKKKRIPTTMRVVKSQAAIVACTSVQDFRIIGSAFSYRFFTISRMLSMSKQSRPQYYELRFYLLRFSRTKTPFFQGLQVHGQSNIHSRCPVVPLICAVTYSLSSYFTSLGGLLRTLNCGQAFIHFTICFAFLTFSTCYDFNYQFC